MANWDQTALDGADAERDEYQLWYMGQRNGVPPQPGLDEDKWYPHLLLLKAPFAKTLALGADVASAASAASVTAPDLTGFLSHDGPVALCHAFEAHAEALLDTSDTQVVSVALHDAVHLFQTLLETDFQTGELVVFVRGLTSADAALQALSDRVAGALAAALKSWLAAQVGSDVLNTVVDQALANDADFPFAQLHPGQADGTAIKAAPADLSAPVPSDRQAHYDSTVALRAAPDDPDAPIVGVIIDHAIGFANRQFCRLSRGVVKTRFNAIWAQDDIAAKSSVGVGQQISASKINSRLEKLHTDPLWTEADLYMDLGLVRRSGEIRRGSAGQLRRQTHGTDVAQVAFGIDPDTGGKFSRKLRLLGVQLPFASVMRTNGVLHDLYVKSAMNWVWFQGLRQYVRQGAYPRYFVNHSYGTYAGRHDGTGPIDADFDWRLHTGESVAITVPSGNSYQSATHARLDGAAINDPNTDTDLGLQLQPDGRAPTFVQIWTDFDAPGAGDFPVSLSLEMPDGTVLSATSGAYQPAMVYSFSQGGALVARLYSQIITPDYLLADPAMARARRVLTLALAPTADESGQPTQVPSGKWVLRFANAEPDMPEIGLWVERGDTAPGFPPGGRQAYLTHPGYHTFTPGGRWPENDAEDSSPIRRAGTLSADANSVQTVAVAAYRNSDRAVSNFSAGSSDLLAQRPDGTPRQPSVAAVSEASAARSDLLVTGTFSNSVVNARGTSMSAPFALRQMLVSALNTTAGAQSPKEQIEAAARADEQQHGTPGAFPERVGQGRLDGMFTPTPSRFTTD